MEYFDYCHPMLSYERDIWDDGIFFIAGIDEVGRGPIAGPVVVAAVVFNKNIPIPVVNDSKKLTEQKREELFKVIINTQEVEYSIIEISTEEIDKINILEATRRAMREVILNLKKIEFALIDGLPVPNFPIKNKAIVKGDSKSASIAAASILAKVYRDNLMSNFAIKYPEYSFEKNKGYGTKEHLEALEKYGPSPIHRKTFAPVSAFFKTEKISQSEFKFY